jgi:carboxypeptidase C (cathepsin A)
VNVGYSYSDDGSTVNTSPVAGIDVHAFLQLFLQRFPEYAHLPFHLAAESYGGTYAPNIAKVVHQANKENALAPVDGITHINLASVVLANGLTDPYVQMGEAASLRDDVGVNVDACMQARSRTTRVTARTRCSRTRAAPNASRSGRRSRPASA